MASEIDTTLNMKREVNQSPAIHDCPGLRIAFDFLIVENREWLDL